MPNNKSLPKIEDLTQHDPQQVADDCCIPVVWCDHQATRRQRIHGANVPGEKRCYSSTHLNEVLQHLIREGWQDAILICETPRKTHLACYVTFSGIEKTPK